MDNSVLQSNVDKKTKPVESLSNIHPFPYVFFGILLPVIALVSNYYIFWGSDFDMLYTVGAMFLLPRVVYLYVTIGSGIVTLLLWMIFFRKYGKRCNGFIGGILLFNAFFDLVFGIAGVYRLLIIPVWLPPFCAAPILFLSSIEAMRISRSVMLKRTVVVTAIAGFLFVLMLSLFIVKQPWGLIKHLPNAHGVNLNGMDLNHIYLDGCNFDEANLSYADLSYAYLRNLNMHKVNLSNASLNHAVLSNVTLTESDLRGVNLNKTKLFEVDFTEANFQNAVLNFHALGRVTMENANLCGADLRDINNIDGVYVWNGAKYNLATLWPKKFDPVTAGGILVENRKLVGIIDCPDKKEGTLINLILKDLNDSSYAVTATELERIANTSKIKIIFQKRGGSIGDSMFVMLAFSEIAKARNYEYFVNLKETRDNNSERIYIVGFTNNKDPYIREEFGKQYDLFKIIMSVSSFKEIAEKIK